MKLIIGLGNPGIKYKETRHNTGFMAIDFLVKKLQPIKNWKKNKKAHYLYISSRIAKKNIILVKPLTYMNNSGQTAALLKNQYGINNQDIVVIHDDIDLDLGTIKISINKSSAGHKGVESIIKALNSKNFIRLRIGIRPKPQKQNPLQSIETKNFVLNKFKLEERKKINRVLKKIPELIQEIINAKQITAKTIKIE